MKKSILTIVGLLFLVVASAQIIDVKSSGSPFTHYWSVGVGAGRANESLRASWLNQLQIVHDSCGFEYVRMHDIFNEDMFVCFDKGNGRIAYNWQYIDDAYDGMLKRGVRPFVELSFFPKAIAAKNSKRNMWYGSYVSVDRSNFGKWHDLIHAFVAHLVERYGIEEVSHWYFEVWNEPNLTGTGGFLHGTKHDYFRLYEEAAKAIKEVDARLKVGGPATSNFIADHRHDGEILNNNRSRFYSENEINKQQWKGVWIEDFIHYCDSANLPIDFISTHAYPTDYALDPVTHHGRGAVRYVNSLYDDLTWLNNVIKNSRYKNAEIHITEWSTSPNSRDALHDALPAAAYIMRACLDCIGKANSLMYWTFTDIFEEKGGGETMFHGGFGLLNYQGIPKPSYYAYSMLHQLGNERLYYDHTLFVSRHSETGKISAVAFNYPKEYEKRVPSAGDLEIYMNASSKAINFRLKGLNPHAKFIVRIVDESHANVLKTYNEMGRPRNPTKAQENQLMKVSKAPNVYEISADNNGELNLQTTLLPWTIMSINEM
jgi:xylan 1,4-beta-xylosidase